MPQNPSGRATEAGTASDTPTVPSLHSAAQTSCQTEDMTKLLTNEGKRGSWPRQAFNIIQLHVRHECAGQSLLSGFMLRKF